MISKTKFCSYFDRQPLT